jgi:flagellar motor switch protein FliN/FliY
MTIESPVAEPPTAKETPPEPPPQPPIAAPPVPDPIPIPIPEVSTMYQMPPQVQYQQPQTQSVNVQPVQFQPFDPHAVMQQKENIGIIMDVPLEISVELGRTHKKIKEILEFTPGTIIELNKLAGEPIDILVNGKFVAKGEVVVIDENFGIRITDIVNVAERI